MFISKIHWNKTEIFYTVRQQSKSVEKSIQFKWKIIEENWGPKKSIDAQFSGKKMAIFKKNLSTNDVPILKKKD